MFSSPSSSSKKRWYQYISVWAKNNKRKNILMKYKICRYRPKKLTTRYGGKAQRSALQTT
jgi:hypothetical protein